MSTTPLVLPDNAAEFVLYANLGLSSINWNVRSRRVRHYSLIIEADPSLSEDIQVDTTSHYKGHHSTG